MWDVGTLATVRLSLGWLWLRGTPSSIGGPPHPGPYGEIKEKPTRERQSTQLLLSV